jgi:periplasmic protein TonB
MFEQVFVNATGRTVRPCAVLASFATQLAVVALAILIPLAYTDVLPTQGWFERTITLQPPDLTSRPVKPVPLPDQFVPLQAPAGRLFEPRAVPAKPAVIIDPPGLLDSGAADVVGLPYGLNFGEGASNLFSGSLSLPAPPAVIPAPPPIRAVPPRVQVGGVVKPPAPLSTPKPIYPLLAIQTRVSGVVRLEAVIGVDGRVHSLRLVQGHPLLVPAAMDAVREWRYTPTLLNGSPVEVVMVVDVNFQLTR